MRVFPASDSPQHPSLRGAVTRQSREGPEDAIPSGRGQSPRRKAQLWPLHRAWGAGGQGCALMGTEVLFAGQGSCPVVRWPRVPLGPARV